ncbi:MAG: DNA double-strand break repair nuclease NurA [Candidatus Micrarchaeota archaeon]|nr:DNA double-strand break repair nuclease NurA [Candidatus Micrarchaeota archaeon]
MQRMDGLKELISELRKVEGLRTESASALKKSGSLVRKCPSRPLDFRVGAVDAGLVAQEFHAFDLVIVKAVGAVFEYKNGKLDGHKYYPGPFPKESVATNGSMDLLELSQYRNIVRLKHEIALAIEVARECDLMLVDGSLVPLPSDKPANKEMRAEYDELISLYIKLFEEAKSKLVGVIKDSRSKRLLEENAHIVGQDVIANSTDSTLLDLVLEKGEMTAPIPYSKDAKANQILKDLMPYSAELNVSYVKAGKNDRPLRVEFFGEGEEVLGKLYPLCSINENYSYPSVLIDVDLRAMISQQDAERIYHEVEVAPFLRGSRLLRRDSRPFRH